MGYELADIIRDHKKSLVLTPHQFKILSQIELCRTKELGKHSIKKCDNPKCNEEVISYNSCRSGSCPKCSGSKQVKWINGRNHEILPVDYSHIVFTPPPFLDKLYYLNQEDSYNILFKSVNELFKEITPRTKSNNPKYGFIAILHTWTQLLKYRTHLHCLVPEGQFNVAKNRWEKSNNKILTKEILNITFKRIFTKNLISWINKNKFIYPGITADYVTEKFKTVKKCVYIRKAFRIVTAVIKYLSTFTNKIAITNDRIKSYDGVNVTVSYVDRADGNKIKEKDIDAVVFLQRYCKHILPQKFTKIRYYGFLANCCKTKYLQICKELLEKAGNKISKLEQHTINMALKALESLSNDRICSVCHIGKMITKYTYNTFRNRCVT